MLIKFEAQPGENIHDCAEKAVEAVTAMPREMRGQAVLIFNGREMKVADFVTGRDLALEYIELQG